MLTEGVYTLPEFWEDLRMAKLAIRQRKPSLLISFDEFVAQVFNERYGVNRATTWRYGKYMLVCIYINANKDAFNVGDLMVAGSYDNLVGDKLCGRVLAYAVSRDVSSISEFPPPNFFLHPEDAK